MNKVKVGQVYAFNYLEDGVNHICPLVITYVDKTHIFYKFPDENKGDMSINRSFPMVKSAWNKNKDNRVLVGITKDKDALEFIP